MKIIPPRLNHLLHILLDAVNPVTVRDLAERLGVSRRTVLREMENVDIVLRPYGLGIGTKASEGMYLSGEYSGRERLRRDLSAMGTPEPSGKQERQLYLALELLTNPEQQKLFFYADRFKVSEATISHDLDVMEPWLKRYKLTLVRKPGYGVSVEGLESSFRGALCAVLSSRKKERPGQGSLSFPAHNITKSVHELLHSRFDCHLNWMTEESRHAFELYVAVSMQRILSHHPLEESDGRVEASFLSVAEHLSDLLEMHFSRKLPAAERRALAVRLAASRSNSSGKPAFEDWGSEYRYQRLAYQMIEQFDPELSPVLKLDEQLVQGLSVHLKAAIVRLENHIELNDPLLTQLSKTFPEVLQKSRRAASVLLEIAPQVPESEAGFLATHFGAAMMRLQERGRRKKSVRIGVVCANGIGTSYLMASQVKKHFTTEAEVEICGWGDAEDWSAFDLILTSTPLPDVGTTILEVNPLLEEEDIKRVRSAIQQCAAIERPGSGSPSAQPLADECARIQKVCSDIFCLLQQFDVLPIEASCTFEQLAKLAGYRFGALPECGRLVYEDLMKREALSTQLIPSLGLILLHTRTAGVALPVFALIAPEGGCFADPALAQTKACVVMLIPSEFSRERTELMGHLSSSLIENTTFLSAVLEGSKEKVQLHLENILRDFLSQILQPFSR